MHFEKLTLVGSEKSIYLTTLNQRHRSFVKFWWSMHPKRLILYKVKNLYMGLLGGRDGERACNRYHSNMEKCLSPVTFLQPLEKILYPLFLHLGRVVVLPFSIILAFSSLACMLQHISSFPFTKIFIVQHINSFHKFRSCFFSIQISVVLFHILSTINFWSRLEWGHGLHINF